MKIWDYQSNENDKLAEHLEKDNTIAFTKDDMAKYLISLINIKENDIVLEPCLGSGSFYNNLPKCKKEYCEINLGLDYLEYKGNPDITLSNPPFVPRKLFWEFHKKAMETTKREIYWLINFSSLNVFTPNRLEEMKEKGWYLENIHIVADKRWFGRYGWCKFTKNKNNFLSYTKQVF